MFCTPSPPQRRSSLKYNHHCIRNLSLPSQYGHRQSSNRVQFARQLSDCVRPVSRSLEAQRVERPRIFISPAEQTRAADCQGQNAKISLVISSHSRTALSPCLSSPSEIQCVLSSLNPGGCKKLLQTIHRPVAVDNQTQVPKIEKKAYTLSPSWCSPNIQTAAHKHNVSKGTRHSADNEILSVFLKNNGGYLDDSDDEDEEEERKHSADDAFNSVRATVAFLKRIPHPFESRTASPSSMASSQLSSAESNDSTRTTSYPSPNFNSPRQFYWNRVQPAAAVTPSKTVSRFTFYKK